MSLRLFVTQSMAALFVASLALAPTSASADEGPQLKRPVHRHHHRHVVKPAPQHVATCTACGVRVIHRTIEGPVHVARHFLPGPAYASACGCGYVHVVGHHHRHHHHGWRDHGGFFATFF